MTPLQSLNDDLAQRLGEMRIVMDEMGEALQQLVSRLENKMELAENSSWLPSTGYPYVLNVGIAACINASNARRALSAYERLRKAGDVS